VIGYVMIFNVQEDAFSPRHRSTWADPNALISA